MLLSPNRFPELKFTPSYISPSTVREGLADLVLYKDYKYHGYGTIYSFIISPEKTDLNLLQKYVNMSIHNRDFRIPVICCDTYRKRE